MNTLPMNIYASGNILHILTTLHQTNLKDILRTFEPQFQKVLRTSQAQKNFAGPYKKKRV